MADWLIVGAGFAGSVLAERIASQRNERVILIDRRDHVGGNAYDFYDAAGILVHRYGPHIFHTNAKSVVEYLSQFTSWRRYEHRVLAHVDGKLLPIPINRDTVNAVFGLELKSDAEAEAFLQSKAETVDEVRTSEDVVVSQIGRELYEKFFQGYTRKQWGLDPAQLDRSVTARIPVRFNTDNRYFNDTFQAMPEFGYTAMFKRMIDHPNIDLRLGLDFNSIKDRVRVRNIVFTGPIDEFFDFRYGRLPYRSLKFEHSTLDAVQHQPVAVVNYPQTEAYTRVTEYKHLTGQVHLKTSITKEYPSSEGDPYYPIPREENQLTYKKYERLASTQPNTWFVGRLATYRYYNMDQVVGQALAVFRKMQDQPI